MLDGNASLNLATFVSTWMDDFASKLYAESYDKNMIDKDEYPQTAAIERSCAQMIAKLWHAPGENHRHLHHRIERSMHARRTRLQTTVAT